MSPGGSATLTVTANQAPARTRRSSFRLGQRQRRHRLQPGQPHRHPGRRHDVGQRDGVNTLANNVIAPNKFIVVSLAPSPASYTVGSPGSAVVKISGSGAQPTATLTSATTYLDEGEPYDVAVGLSQAVSTPADDRADLRRQRRPGHGLHAAGGEHRGAGRSDVGDGADPDRDQQRGGAEPVLTVSLAPSSSYVVGSPSSASVTLTSQVLPTLTISATPRRWPRAARLVHHHADQAPVKNTSVNFSAQGTAEPGQNYVPLAGTAVLKAGQTQVTVVLQSIQSNISFEPTDMIVGNWPTHVGQVFVKAGASVAPGEAILSLTEPDLSVTLQATAAERSELAVGQTLHDPDLGREQLRERASSPSSTTAPTTVTGSAWPVLAGLRGPYRRVRPHRGRRLRGLDHGGQPAGRQRPDRPDLGGEAERVRGPTWCG